MNTNISSSPSVARQLVERLSSRLENEKRELVLFLIELAEFDAKKLALELGYPSTLGCLMTELRLSESSACRRIAAARMLARFPQIGGYLLASRLTLMSLVALKDVLDETNVDELLERASGLQRARGATAGLAHAARRSQRSGHSGCRHRGGRCSRHHDGNPSDGESGASRRSAGDDAVGGTRVSRGARGGAHAAWSCRAKRQAGRGAAPRSPRAAQGDRAAALRQPQAGEEDGRDAAACRSVADYIPAAVRREVYEREGGTCAYVGEGQRRCGSTLRLEYQHIVPVARGGRSTLENITLYCRAHNLLQAEKDFGAEHVRRKQLERSAADSLVRLGYPRRQAEQVVGIAIDACATDLGALVHRSLQILARSLR